jgi:homoserine kinase type II
MDHTPITVLAAYGIACPPAGVEPRGTAGGFSGAQFWKVLAGDRAWCLRRWPAEHPTPTRLQWMHAVLEHVARRGLTMVPVPRRTAGGATFVELGGHPWELTPWMPGEANFRRLPTPGRLAAALQALARFHRAAADFPGFARRGVSPGIVRRQELLARWLDGGADQLGRAATPQAWPDLFPRAQRILTLFSRHAESVAATLAEHGPVQVDLQPCIRDIWHDHVLFMGDEVSGLVDFGSMEQDSVATDIGRLLGSLAGDDAERWSVGLRAYQEIRPLGGEELRLVRCFDRSTTLMAGLNWLQWVYVEQRQFSDPSAVIARIDEILSRLERLSNPAGR